MRIAIVSKVLVGLMFVGAWVTVWRALVTNLLAEHIDADVSSVEWQSIAPTAVSERLLHWYTSGVSDGSMLAFGVVVAWFAGIILHDRVLRPLVGD